MRWKATEGDNAKVNVSPNIPCIFLLFKYFFTKEQSIKTSNEKTHISLLINQFVSLNERKMQRLTNYWTSTCKFKIDKIAYSKSYPQQPMNKNKP